MSGNVAPGSTSPPPDDSATSACTVSSCGNAERGVIVACHSPKRLDSLSSTTGVAGSCIERSRFIRTCTQPPRDSSIASMVPARTPRMTTAFPTRALPTSRNRATTFDRRSPMSVCFAQNVAPVSVPITSKTIVPTSRSFARFIAGNVSDELIRSERSSSGSANP